LNTAKTHPKITTKPVEIVAVIGAEDLDPELPEVDDADAVEVVEELADVLPFSCFASC
jgi:hypothetical protein